MPPLVEHPLAPRDTLSLPPVLVRTLLVQALQTAEGRALWLGYTLGQERAPWLAQGNFQLVDCAATVLLVTPEPPASSPNGVALEPGMPVGRP